MPLSVETIETSAPDASALSAARKIRAEAWSALGRERALIWGECQGSGSSPYRATVDTSDLWTKCSCPSRKFPCKHALSLMFAFLARADAFGDAALPEWVSDWTARRRPGGGGGVGKPAAQTKDARGNAGGSGAESGTGVAASAAPESEEPADPDAIARANARRKRLAEQREESVRAGLDELDRWIADQLERGLATFAQRAPEQCRLLAKRLVDAKAPALATRLEALPSEILALPEADRAAFTMETLGLLHLLGEAFRRVDAIPEMLRHDVRRLIGWTLERQDLLDDASSLRASSVWFVLAVHSEIQPDRLRRNEAWLIGREGQFAVLIDFVPVAVAHAGSSFTPGEAFEAELVFYPSAAPLRALIARRGAACPFPWPRAPATLGGVLDAYDALAARFPWAGAHPFFVDDVKRIARSERDLWLEGSSASIPVTQRQHDAALALTTSEIAGLAGLWDGRAATILFASTSLGAWYRAP